MDDPMDDEARKLAADQSAEAIRERARASRPPRRQGRAQVQGVDDEWARPRGLRRQLLR